MVDLHSHTDRSDGVLTPSELVDLAKEVRLSALGISDHDTIQACEEICDYARQQGVELVHGVELAAKFRNRSIHVLGYFLEAPPDALFGRRLDQLAAQRAERNLRLVEKLQSIGVDITIEEVRALGKHQTGRPHFARLLIQKGYCPDFRSAFEMFLDERAPGFVPREELSLGTVLKWIRESGGISSWAHPARFVRASGEEPEALFHEIAEQGMMSIECYHRDHEPIEAENYRAAAQKLGLGVTGGSDFHGPTPGGVPLGGMHIPDMLLDNLKAYSRKVYSA
jgi:predicted metal-dependent phosphoesterase TrpH